MTQMLLEAKSKLALKPIERLAKQQGFSVRYVAPVRTEKKSTNPLNPSPSGDPWWDDPRNAAMVAERVERAKRGEAKYVRMEDSPVLQRIFAEYGTRKKEYV